MATKHPSPTGRGTASRGFTLIEVAIVVVVTAIVASLAAPAMRDLIDSRRLVGAAAQLAADVELARTEAVARNRAVRLSFHAGAGSSCYVVHTGAADQCTCAADGAALCTGGAHEIKTIVLADIERVTVGANVALDRCSIRCTARARPAARLRVARRARSGSAPRRQRRGPRPLVLAARRRRRLSRLLKTQENAMSLSSPSRRIARLHADRDDGRGRHRRRPVEHRLSLARRSRAARPPHRRPRRPDAGAARRGALPAPTTPSYGSLAEIGMRASSTAGHYSLEVTANSATGYAVLASASGVQASRQPTAAICGSRWTAPASATRPAPTRRSRTRGGQPQMLEPVMDGPHRRRGFVAGRAPRRRPRSASSSRRRAPRSSPPTCTRTGACSPRPA